MGAMSFVVFKVVWRMLTRLLRQLGWGALMVPVAALGMAVFGLSLWTIAAVVLAVIVTLRRPAIAAAVVPVMMVCVGLAGLVLAAATPGVSVFWSARGAAVMQVGPVPGRFSYVVPAQVQKALAAPGKPVSVTPAQIHQAVGGGGQVTVSVRPAQRKFVRRQVVVTRKGVPGKGVPGNLAGQAFGPAVPVPPPPIPPAALAKLGHVTVEKPAPAR